MVQTRNRKSGVCLALFCVVTMGMLFIASSGGRAASDTDSQTAPVSAVVSLVQGEVTLTRPEVDGYLAVVEGMDILVGDELTTSSDGDIELTLVDLNMLKIGPSSHIVVIEVSMVEVTGLSNTVIDLIYGKIRALVTPFVNKESSFAVETENATIGVRGTDFGVSYDLEKDILEAICLTGELEVSSPEWLEQGLEPIVILSGEGVTIEGGGHPGRSKSKSKKSIQGFFGPLDFEGPTGAPEGILGPAPPGVTPDPLGVENPLDTAPVDSPEAAPSGLDGAPDGPDAKDGGPGGGPGGGGGGPGGGPR